MDPQTLLLDDDDNDTATEEAAAAADAEAETAEPSPMAAVRSPSLLLETPTATTTEAQTRRPAKGGGYGKEGGGTTRGLRMSVAFEIRVEREGGWNLVCLLCVGGEWFAGS